MRCAVSTAYSYIATENKSIICTWIEYTLPYTRLATNIICWCVPIIINDSCPIWASILSALPNKYCEKSSTKYVPAIPPIKYNIGLLKVLADKSTTPLPYATQRTKIKETTRPIPFFFGNIFSDSFNNALGHKNIAWFFAVFDFHIFQNKIISHNSS